MISIRIRRKYLFYVVAILSSIISSITVGLDTIITSRMSAFYSPDEVSWIFGFSAFFIGFLISTLIGSFFSIRLNNRRIGSLIDPAFHGIRLIKREELKYHLFAGMGNAITTVGYFYVLSLLPDPSAVTPFYRVVILYLLIVETIVEKNAPTLIEFQSSTIVTLGAILGSISITGDIEVVPLAVMLLIVNPGWVLLSIYQRKLKLLKPDGKPNDSINIRIWNLFFTTIFVTAFILIQDFILGTNYLAKSLEGSIRFFWLVALTMGITFFSYVLYIRALGMGKASITEGVRASIVIFSIPVTLILSLFIPIPIPQSPALWLIKIIGIILVVLGIVSFALTQVTAYILVRATPGTRISDLIENIWNIRGVESVAAVAGKYDIIAKVRIRTLIKGYERIIRRLESIPGISYFEWKSVLKEWENV